LLEEPFPLNEFFLYFLNEWKRNVFFLKLSRTTWDKKEVPPTHARAHDCSRGFVASLTCEFPYTHEPSSILLLLLLVFFFYYYFYYFHDPLHETFLGAAKLLCIFFYVLLSRKLDRKLQILTELQ
jgi:hypothetical protein